jgi:hypothetical protein
MRYSIDIIQTNFQFENKYICEGQSHERGGEIFSCRFIMGKKSFFTVSTPPHLSFHGAKTIEEEPKTPSNIISGLLLLKGNFSIVVREVVI